MKSKPTLKSSSTKPVKTVQPKKKKKRKGTATSKWSKPRSMTPKPKMRLR